MKQLLLVLLVGCVDQAPYDLELKGATTANGDDLHVRLVEMPGAAVIAHEWAPFERPITYGDLLAEGVNYELTLFVDHDGDTHCTAADSVFQLDLIHPTGKITIDLDHESPRPTACASFP